MQNIDAPSLDLAFEEEINASFADHADGEQELTEHSRNRMAALQAFEKIYEGAQDQLLEISSRISRVTTYHHSVRELSNILHTEIHRANELELANASIISEHRKLFDDFQMASKRSQERETLLEHFQQREFGLNQENEALRSDLATAKLDLVESGNRITRLEADLANLNQTLSVRASEAERHARENDGLREKYVQVSLDLDRASKHLDDTTQKLAEMQSLYEAEVARHSDMTSVLSTSEREVVRLQKAYETSQAQLADTRESARVAAEDAAADEQRYLAEAQVLRAHLEDADTRIDGLLKKHTEASVQAADLGLQLKDAVTDRHVAEEKLAALSKENQGMRGNLAAMQSQMSELSMQRASEQIDRDMREQEVEDLKADIETLQARIRDLLPYERLHRVTLGRETNGQKRLPDLSGASDVGAPAALVAQQLSNIRS